MLYTLLFSSLAVTNKASKIRGLQKRRTFIGCYSIMYLFSSKYPRTFYLTFGNTKMDDFIFSQIYMQGKKVLFYYSGIVLYIYQ